MTVSALGPGHGAITGGPRRGPPGLTPPTSRERALHRPQAGRGAPHDLRDRDPQLLPVPDDAGLARARAHAQPRHHPEAQGGRPCPLGPGQAADPGPARRVRGIDLARATSATRSSSAASRSPRSSAAASGRRSCSSGWARSSRSSSACCLGPTQGGDAAVDARQGRQRDRPDPVLDAVLRASACPDHHLRRGPGLVPDLRDARPPGGSYESGLEQVLRLRPPSRPAADRRSRSA